MKKFLIASFLLFSMALTVNAANGDIVSYIYSTDIRAYINGVEVQSYNIGGKTAVVIEDILDNSQYLYKDETRTLELYSLNPEWITGHKTLSTKPGNVVGKVLETDIKTTIYNVVLPSYNMGGKTAVVIEDLGGDRIFSTIGGKYIWDEGNRTIKLEFMYDNSHFLPNNKQIHIVPDGNLSEANATFKEIIHCDTPQIFTIDYDNITPINFPIKAKTEENEFEIIGYHLRIPLYDISFASVTYYYPEKLEKALRFYEPVNATIDSIIEHFETVHYASLSDRYDTEEYTVARLCLAFTSGSYNYIVQAYKDGTFKEYMYGIHNTKKSIRDFKIDKENEKIMFKYTDRYTDDWFTNYEIDLKTGVMTEL